MNPCNSVMTFALLAGCLALGPALSLQAATITWSGGGDGVTWNDPANWDSNSVPTAADEARFTDTGLTSSKIIDLGADQAVALLTLDTTNAFKLGTNSGTIYGLTVSNLTRTATSANTQTIYAKVIIPDGSQPASLWDIEGPGSLSLSYSASATSARGTITGTNMVKTGAGQLNLGPWGGNPNFKGTLYVNAGTVYLASVTGSSVPALVLGDGTNAALAYYRADQGTQIVDSGPVTVKSNAVLKMSVTSGEDVIGGLTLDGGIVTNSSAGGLHVGGPFSMRGGAVLGGAYMTLRTTVSIAADSAQMPLFTASMKVGRGSPGVAFDVGDSPTLPIDFKVTGAMVDYTSALDYGLSKAGAGVMQVTGANTYGAYGAPVHGATTINGGTLLVDNSASSGTGKGPVNVNAGGTLGGTGFIGGVVGNYTNANVTVSGVATTNAIVAPGSIDATTGDHIVGTLTVGSAAQTNNVTFSKYGLLSIHFASDGTRDQLAVHGTVTLGQTNTLSLLSVPSTLKDGTYTLVSADNGVSGQFGATNGLPSGGAIVYNATTIQLSIPPSGSVIMVR